MSVALLARLAQRAPMQAVVLAIPLLFLAAGLQRAAPFVDDIVIEGEVDDWMIYKRNALSILNDGLRMPVVPGVYARPGGFLYNYFVAGMFAVAGVNSAWVYVAQSALLGLSISMMYLAFRRYLTPVGGLVYITLLSAFLAVDMFRAYTFRLLSENLLLFLVPPTLWLVLRAHERQRASVAGMAGFFAGMAMLARPNLLLFGPGAAVLLAICSPHRGRRRHVLPLVLLTGFAVAALALPLRNHAVAGSFSMGVLTTDDWARPRVGPFLREGRPPEAPSEVLEKYTRRVLFALGFNSVMVPEYRVRMHWVAMWAGVAVFLGFAARRRTLAFWEALLVAYVVLYLGPLLAVGGIANYGFRMIVPGIPAALLLAVRGGELTAQAIRHRWPRLFVQG